MIDKRNITGIILAGGKSARMGTDKGFLKLNSKTFIEHSIEALKPLVSKIIIVSNNPDYDIFNFERVEDIIKDAGPLAGLYSGLKQSKTEFNLVLSCDVPLINQEILASLIEAQDSYTDIVQIVSQGQSMPLIALYNKRCESVFYKLLIHNERRLHIAVNQCKVKNIELNFKNDLFTLNINTPEELKKVVHANHN